MQRAKAGVGFALSTIVGVVSLATACRDSTSPTQIPNDPGTTVSIAFCAGNEPSWVAFQDGDGEWTQAQPTTAGSSIIYEKTFNSGRGAVAAVRLSQGLSSLSVQYGKPEELAIVSISNPLFCIGAETRALLGTVAGLEPNEEAQINAGFGVRALPLEGDNSFSLTGLQPGPQEILASRVSRLDPSSPVVTRFILRRVGDLADGTTLPVFDFSSAESFAPVVSTVTIAGLGPEGGTVNTVLRTPHSESVESFGVNDMTAATRSYRALPESKLETGELQLLAVNGGPVTTGDFRSAALYFRAPVEQTLTLGPVLARPAFSIVATTPALRLRARFPAQNEYDRQTGISYLQGSTTVVSVAMTAAYAALSGAGYDIVVPDLSHAPGFDPAWALHSGIPLFWTAERIGGTLGLGVDAVPFDGATSRTAIAFDNLPN